MDKLIQTAEYSIIYGDFKRENSAYPYQELFRCPRKLDNADLSRYVNENRCLLGFEADTKTEDLKESDRYFGYFRMYFRNGTWQGNGWRPMGKSKPSCATVLMKSSNGFPIISRMAVTGKWMNILKKIIQPGAMRTDI